jgi:hypothetical protein
MKVLVQDGASRSLVEVSSLASEIAAAVLTAAWPIGAIFTAMVSTDPAMLLGFGTWAAFGSGRVLVGRNGADADFDTAEEMGGAKTVTPTGTVSQPTFTGDALGTHSHGAGTLAPSAHAGAAVTDHAAHTHGAGTLVPSAHSGTAVAQHNAHSHSYTQVPNHVHVERAQGGTTASTTGTHLMTSTATGGSLRSSAQSTLDPTGGVATANTDTGPGVQTHNVTQPSAHTMSGSTGNPSATLSHAVTQPSDHTMSGSSQAVSGGTPAGTVSQPTFTGDATSVVQPYIVVYFWKRTA